MLLSGISNWRQPVEADCLVACVAMVLNYLAVAVHYERLRQLLGTTEAGTPFSHVDRLRTRGWFVERGRGTMETLRTHLTLGLPVIVAVRTDGLPHWISRTDLAEEEKATDHAVVVVGLDSDNIYVNDPDFAQAPQVIEVNEFLLAWSDRDYEYAVIGLEDFHEDE